MPPKKKDPPAGQRSIAAFFSPKPGAAKVTGQSSPASTVVSVGVQKINERHSLLQDAGPAPAHASKLCKPAGAADTGEAKAAAGAS